MSTIQMPQPNDQKMGELIYAYGISLLDLLSTMIRYNPKQFSSFFISLGDRF